MLRKFAVKDGEYPEKPPCAMLFYDEETDGYSVEIEEWTNPADLPAILGELVKKGIRKDSGKWARRFVEERVIPSDRQNIGMIMRQLGMKYYSEFPILEYTNGRCCMDDFFLEEVKE